MGIKCAGSWTTRRDPPLLSTLGPQSPVTTILPAPEQRREARVHFVDVEDERLSKWDEEESRTRLLERHFPYTEIRTEGGESGGQELPTTWLLCRSFRFSRKQDGPSSIMGAAAIERAANRAGKVCWMAFCNLQDDSRVDPR